MADRGFPKAWRHMNLYACCTCLWVNHRGERFLVKYHLITDQGIEFGPWAEACLWPEPSLAMTPGTCTRRSNAEGESARVGR